MAKAELKTRTIKEVTLTLSLAQAMVIRTVLEAVGGYPTTSLRGLVDEVNGSLRDAGVVPFQDQHEGSILFKEGSLELAKEFENDL